MYYDKRNRENLDKLAPNTKVAAYKWYDRLIAEGIEVLIYETKRTIETQRAYFASGKSQTMKSYHLIGQALDWVLTKDKECLWGSYFTPDATKVIRIATELGFESGRNWTDFVDSPHLQYNYKGYASDITLSPASPPPPSSPFIGRVRVIVDVLNVREERGTDSPIIGKAIRGRVFNVISNYKNLWMQVAYDDNTIGWISTGHEFGTPYLELV